MEYVFAEKVLPSGAKAVVSNDTSPTNPRNRDCKTQMIFWLRHNDLGDEHNYKDPEHLMVSLQLEYNPHLFGEYEYDTLEYIPEELHDSILNADIPGVFKKVYKYEHGNIALSFGPFYCPWDSGPIGYLHIPPEAIEAEGWDMDQAERWALGELKEYQQYVNGEVYLMVLSEEGCVDEVVGDIYAEEPGIFPSDEMLDDMLMSLMAIDDKNLKFVRDTPWKNLM